MSSELFTFKEFICETGREVKRHKNSLSYSAIRSTVYVTIQQIVCPSSTVDTHTHYTNAQVYTHKLTKTDFTLTRPLHK